MSTALKTALLWLREALRQPEYYRDQHAQLCVLFGTSSVIVAIAAAVFWHLGDKSATGQFVAGATCSWFAHDALRHWKIWKW